MMSLDYLKGFYEGKTKDDYCIECDQEKGEHLKECPMPALSNAIELIEQKYEQGHKDGWIDGRKPLEVENEKLNHMLKTCRKAIESLDTEALGTVPDHPDYGYGWPIKEELLSNIDALLTGGDDERS